MSTAQPVRDPVEVNLSRLMLCAFAMEDLKAHFAAFPTPAVMVTTSLMIEHLDPTDWDCSTKRALLKSDNSSFWKKLFDAGHAPDTD
jgi:hypothetical protein